ncbi:efflux transporter periplasmic adaptor subunit [Pacificimonas flava]|uniref:Efflux transporter periplasmic adaptor subunit n=2 Tax=Pacificimonas TaxID=1960290 RepID=A0A219B0U4_9SPHN|nr:MULTISPECIES: efflux RND transporter periplasmic adaptor subunit [Pacificimonas]MBZ6379579.1 efflux RND transporter periplasmic adaptor subunit [Pacificimonas aurantium]OWV31947.1 efflux transporter periplasmic adaptor subunit [Pacificimonas flava]
MADAIKNGWQRLTGRQSRTILVTVVLLALVLGGLFLWRAARTDPGQPPEQQPVPVAATIVTPRDVPASLEAVGTLSAVRSVTLSPEVAGRVTAIRFEAGDYVQSGELLVQLFDAPERADRQAAIARAEFTRTQVARSEELAPTGAEPRELLDQRRAERDQAIAAVQQIEARLAQKRIRAPFAGRIGLRRVDLGEYLNPGDPVATLTSLDRLYVEFALPQQELARLDSGAAVTVTSDAFPERTFTARVNAIEPVIGEETRNVTVQAILPNPDGALRSGMYVTAALELPPQRNALLVPATAIQTTASGNNVIAIRGDTPREGGTAEIVSVETGRRIGNSVLVTSGLQAGDIVVTEGQLRVQPGAQVRVARIVQRDQASGAKATDAAAREER